MSASDPSVDFGCSVGIVGGGSAGNRNPASSAELQVVANQLAGLNKTLQELLAVGREQLEVARRNEARHLRHIQSQREELQQWLGPDQLGGRCSKLHFVLRDTLGKSLEELADFVEHNEENLTDSEFVRSDLVDRYGAQMNHLSALYGLMRRLAMAEADGDERPHA